MDPRQLLLILRADLLQVTRRAVSAGPGRLAAGAGGAAVLAATEAWGVHRLTARLLALPAPWDALGLVLLGRGIALVAQLGFAVVLSSAVTLALPQLERLEGEAFSAAVPVPGPFRGIQGLWRTAGGLVWAVVLLLPLEVTAAAARAPGPWGALRSTVALLALLLAGCALGTGLAVALAALIPRRVLLPAAWTGATAAVVGAVLWLRHLRPERFFSAQDLTATLTALGGGTATGSPLPGRWLAEASHRWVPVILLVALALLSSAAAAAIWGMLGRRAGGRLQGGGGGRLGRSWLWPAVDAALAQGPGGALAASRLRWLFRDTTQSAQVLYLVGLGVVYVQNLRSLPLDDPLARELAALINLAMAGLLAAALSLRFAYPAALMEGPAAWWWSTGPVSRPRGLAATGAVAALPPLLLCTALFATASFGMGATSAGTKGWWLVPWIALWTTALGVILGPEPGTGGNWLDAALGVGGLTFLALSVGGVAWVVTAAGRATLATVVSGLGGSWQPGLLLGRPALAAAILTAATSVLGWRRLRGRGPGGYRTGPPARTRPDQRRRERDGGAGSRSMRSP